MSVELRSKAEDEARFCISSAFFQPLTALAKRTSWTHIFSISPK
jgi:hypothetical protein